MTTTEGRTNDSRVVSMIDPIAERIETYGVESSRSNLVLNQVERINKYALFYV